MTPNWLASFLSVSALLFGAKIFGAGAGFLTHVLLARTLSPDALGKYFLVVSVISLCGIFAAFGYPSVMGRFITRYMNQFISRYRHASGQSLLSGFIWYAKVDTLRNAALLTPLAIAWIALGPSVQLKDGASLFCIAMAIPAVSMMRINGSLATALRHYKTAYLPDLLFRPVSYFCLLSVFVFVLGIRSWELFVVAFCLLAATAALGQHFVLTRLFKPRARLAGGSRRAVNIWRRTSRPFLLVTVIASFFVDLQLILTSQILNPSAVAVVGICLKIAFLFGFVIDVAHGLPVRDIGDALSNGDTKSVDTKLMLINAVSFGITILTLLFILLFGDLILRVFGKEFERYELLLLTFFMIHFIRAVFGPNIMLLTFIGEQHKILIVYIFSLILMTVAIFILTPLLGIMGVGLSALIFFVVSNLSLSIILYRSSGLRSDIFHSANNLMANGAAEFSWPGRFAAPKSR